jgi:uncharacterized protein YuzE
LNSLSHEEISKIRALLANAVGNDKQDDSNSALSTKALHYTYDNEVDASYLYLRDIANGEVADTHTCINLPDSVKGEINLDFDKDGKLVGIEILDASKVLPAGYSQS